MKVNEWCNGTAVCGTTRGMSSSLANWKHIIAKMTLKPRDNWLCTVYRFFLLFIVSLAWFDTDASMYVPCAYECCVPNDVQTIVQRTYLHPDIASNDKKTLNCALQQRALCTSDSCMNMLCIRRLCALKRLDAVIKLILFIYLFLMATNAWTLCWLYNQMRERHTETANELRWDQMRNETKPNWIVSFNFKVRKWVWRRRRRRKSHLAGLLAQIIQSNFIPCCALFTLSVESVVCCSASCS